MVRKWKKREVFTQFKRKVLGERKRLEKRSAGGGGSCLQMKGLHLEVGQEPFHCSEKTESLSLSLFLSFSPTPPYMYIHSCG